MPPVKFAVENPDQVQEAEQILRGAGRLNGKPANHDPIAEPVPFTWIGGAELMLMKPRKKNMIVDKIMPGGGLTMNASKAKTGKTSLMIELCYAVATGTPALGKYEVQQGPVLYWLADDANVPRFAEAWKIVTDGATVENFHLCVMRQALYPDGLINLRKAIDQFKPVLIVADSYTTIRSPRARNTDFVLAEYNDMKLLSELGEETGAGINLIHHQSKAKQADPFDAAAGSYAIGAGPDARMNIEKLNGTERLIRIDGRDVDEFQLVYARDANRRLFAVIDGPAAEDWRRLHEAAVRLKATPFSTKDAGELLGLGDRHARRVLILWEQMGALVEHQRGTYLLDSRIIEAAENVRKAANA